MCIMGDDTEESEAIDENVIAAFDTWVLVQARYLEEDELAETDLIGDLCVEARAALFRLAQANRLALVDSQRRFRKSVSKHEQP